MRASGLWRVGLTGGAAVLAGMAISWALTWGGPLAPGPIAAAPVPRHAVATPPAEPAGAPPLLAPIARALGASAGELGALQEVYGPAGVVPIWLAGGVPTAQADEAMAMLHAAARHGLDPAAYLGGPLAAALAAGSEEAPVEARAEAQPEYDVALSLGVLRYMRHLRLGRVDPRAVGLRIDTWSEPHDFPARLRQAVADNRVVPAVESLAPPFAVYARLADALPHYRALVARHDPEVPRFARAVHPDEPYAGAHALGVHLAARGDLAPGDVPPAHADRYEGALVEAVRRFQARHGLTPDGVLGARTVAAARVPASARARQIEMALERLRWLPDLGRRRLVVVNIPMFRAWAWDTLGPSPVPAFTTRVIVGRAGRTETPVFVATMDHVIFRPYWNVPRSILRDEVLPAIRRDAGYLSRQQMEVVSGAGDDARPVGLGPGTLEALAAGTLRVRQRPGPHNALGLVKFVFPNPESVYMHGTPTPSLFARDRRDFSHGCIRLADPSGLARWALAGTDGWDADRIAQAMQAPVSTRVDLAAPIDVVLFYMTAAVLPDDGAVHFADDIYGHDAALERALGAVTSVR